MAGCVLARGNVRFKMRLRAKAGGASASEHPHNIFLSPVGALWRGSLRRVRALESKAKTGSAQGGQGPSCGLCASLGRSWTTSWRVTGFAEEA